MLVISELVGGEEKSTHRKAGFGGGSDMSKDSFVAETKDIWVCQQWYHKRQHTKNEPCVHVFTVLTEPLGLDQDMILGGTLAVRVKQGTATNPTENQIVVERRLSTWPWMGRRRKKQTKPLWTQILYLASAPELLVSWATSNQVCESAPGSQGMPPKKNTWEVLQQVEPPEAH